MIKIFFSNAALVVFVMYVTKLVLWLQMNQPAVPTDVIGGILALTVVVLAYCANVAVGVAAGVAVFFSAESFGLTKRWTFALYAVDALIGTGALLIGSLGAGIIIALVGGSVIIGLSHFGRMHFLREA
jgi:hypothetical protein